MHNQRLNQRKHKASAMNDNDTDEEKNDLKNQFVFNINKDLIIDPRHIHVRKLIAEGPYSLVYAGEYAFFFFMILFFSLIELLLLFSELFFDIQYLNFIRKQNLDGIKSFLCVIMSKVIHITINVIRI